ncbi:nucleotidyltransferase domain-containing protein [Rheinheimera sp. YQF-2]|jgi:predicted nucleotidyltransferase|uniref:Nucleotidyltransferase domain-containing protein n=1 Tax=Rheinheimera lutimaris TaxID=2740584 RepID=A0A7Y5APQ3_9GAMM|nr:nucleotidyltransferase domain-containing protein [Rheinheimera lutimaris]NRQ42217.1 nucleotidyltransferase domain-containing protein [Rheinheimera lutimaris]
MRLTDQQQEIIKQVLLKHFGKGSELRLFGSRADDNARGGDIDLYIEPELRAADDIVEARLNALVELHMALGEQKIDLVINRKAGTVLPIYKIAKETGIRL